MPGEEGSIYTVPDDVLVQELPNGEAVLLALSTEAYYGLDPVGAAMYAALREHGSVPAAVETLSGEYDVDRETLERDLRRLCDQLVERGLLAQMD